MSDTQPKTTWLDMLIDQVHMLSEEFGLSDAQTVRLKDFTIGLAKEQYRIGNKYGASWAFKRAREEAGRPLQIQPSV